MRLAPLLRFVGRVLLRCADRIAVPTQAAPPPESDPEIVEAQRKRSQREGLRRGLRPWYYSRGPSVRVPESLKYYEDVHGTKATLELLQKIAERREA